MARKRSGYLEVNRKSHGVLWWLFIGWWERPLASIWWYMLADISGYRGVKYHYYTR